MTNTAEDWRMEDKEIVNQWKLMKRKCFEVMISQNKDDQRATSKIQYEVNENMAKRKVTPFTWINAI